MSHYSACLLVKSACEVLMKPILLHCVTWQLSVMLLNSKMERSKEIEMRNVEKKMKVNIVVHTKNGKMKQANLLKKLMKMKQGKLMK